MKTLILAALTTVLGLTIAKEVMAQTNYDYCLTARKWTAGPGSGRTQCGFVNKDSPTCAINWTSDSNSGTACWETGQNFLNFGCVVYDQYGSNLLGDIATCEILKPDTCTTDPFTGAITCSKQFWFYSTTTPDDGDGN